MKLTLLLFLSILTLTLAEYPRMKYRGPPPYPKPPPYQQIQKKWQHPPPRPPLRSRPQNHPRPTIPVHMPNHHKIQMGVAASVNRPVAVPIRNFWKNTQPTFRPPLDHHFVTSAPVLPKKVFQSSPAILAQEYDFQLQSNNIPTPIKTIKQIGEKGPIHTIPAPNLSPADKPLVVEEVKPKHQQIVEEVKHHPIQRQPEVATYVQIQKSHQYQVTEAPELAKQTLYKNLYETQNLQPHEIYQLINTYQQPVVLQDPQNYLQYSSIVPQHSQNFVEPIPQEHFALDKSSFEELPKQESPKKESSSLVTAAYNLEPEPSESIIHSQYVQNYFDSRDSTVNKVEPDAKPSERNNKNNTLDGFYVSLPNKEAAEALSNLQAAGQLNSNLMQRSKNGQELPVSIYVPEEEGSRDETDQSEEEEEPAYDDYANEDLITEEMKQGGEGFGHRLQPKK